MWAKRKLAGHGSSAALLIPAFVPAYVPALPSLSDGLFLTNVSQITLSFPSCLVFIIIATEKLLNVVMINLVAFYKYYLIAITYQQWTL